MWAQEFVEDYEPTKIDSYQTIVSLPDGAEVDVQITDTAGNIHIFVSQDLGGCNRSVDRSSSVVECSVSNFVSSKDLS